jgi:hypothetical protein
MFQMPKQDISHDHCQFLKNEDAVKHYQKFIEERNHNALDIGLCLINSDDPDLVFIRRFIFEGIYLYFMFSLKSYVIIAMILLKLILFM